jgi:hypothetical protein
MTDEQSIRDELAQVIFERSHTPNDALNLWDGDINKIVDALLASPVIRRIQAEAWTEGHAAGRDYQGDGWNSDAHDPEADNPYRGETA